MVGVARLQGGHVAGVSRLKVGDVVGVISLQSNDFVLVDLPNLQHRWNRGYGLLIRGRRGDYVRAEHLEDPFGDICRG